MAEYFYHNLLRKYMVMTESFFKDITIYKDTKPIKVPVSFHDKNKFIQRYRRRDIALKGVKMTIPRIAYTFTNIYYDNIRKLNRVYKFSKIEDDKSINTFTPVPYNIDIEVSILTNKNQDVWQIIEQILPMFSPDIKFTSNLIAENDINLDLSLCLNSVYINDNNHNSLNVERHVEYGLNLTLKCYFFREIFESNIITDIKNNFYDFDNNTLIDVLEISKTDL